MSNWDEKEEAEAPGTAPWLEGIMRVALPALAPGGPAQTDEAFSARCREAAEAALIVSKLRKERLRVGFVPLSLVEYIHGLVKLAGVPLAPVFSWLGVTDLAAARPQSVFAAARLARELGMSAREAVAHLRISFAAHVGSAPVSLLVARYRSTGLRRTPLEECEEALEQIESGYDLDNLHKLRDLESEIGAAYK